MINYQIEKKLLGSKLIFPQYQDYCFSNIHQTIINLLTNQNSPSGLPSDVLPKEEFSHIFLILIDALGYLSFKKFQQYFSLPKKALISPLTTIFPSTTAATLSTLSTGLLPQEHGLFEWRLYIPQIGDIIKTLPFCFDNNHQQDQLADLGFDPEKIFFEEPTIYQKLAKRKIPSFVFNHQNYYKSAFASIAQNGAKPIPFTSFSELLTTLNQTITKITNKYPKTFTYAYLDSLDSIGHKYGPESDYFKTELAQIALMINKFLLKPLEKSSQPKKSKSLVLITADHGQVQINPKETIYLNHFRKLKKNLALKPNQKPIMATGGPRDVFLHLKRKNKKETIAYLKKKLASKANVYSSTEALKKGWFGNRQSTQKFLERLGDVLILPQDNHTVWLGDEEKKIDKLGHHGGITAEEMLIPFIAIPF